MLRRLENHEVARMLRALLVDDPDKPKDYARTVAGRMKVPYSTLAKYWSGEKVFPAALVRALFEATDYDRRVAELFLTEGTGHRLVRDQAEGGERDLSRALSTLTQLDGEVHRLHLDATSPQSEGGSAIAPTEANELAEGLRKLVQRADQIRAALKGAGR